MLSADNKVSRFDWCLPFFFTEPIHADHSIPPCATLFFPFFSLDDYPRMKSDSNKFSDLRDTNSIPSPPLIDVADLLSHDRMQRAMSDTILSSTDKRFMGNYNVIHSYNGVFSFGAIYLLDDTMPVYSGSIRAPSRSSPVSPAPSNPLDDYFLCDDTALTNTSEHGNTVLIYKEPSHHSSLPSDHASAKNDTLSNDDKNGRYGIWSMLYYEDEVTHIVL